MKKIYLYFIILLAATMLCCCNRNDTFRTTLDRADSTLNQQPEKTMAILDSIKPEANSVSKDLRMRYLLLLAQSRNKSYQPLPSEDTLQAIIDYYRKHGTDNDRMQSLYMMGSLYRDKGDAPMALKYYNEAVAAANTADSKCDLVTLSRVYGQMAGLFHTQKAPRFELKYDTIAEKIAWKAKDTLAAVMYMEYRSWAYRLLNDTDSIYFISKRAEKTYRQLGKHKEAAQTMLERIDIFICRDSLKQAKQAIDIFEKHSGLFDNNNEIRNGAENYYDLKGKYYLKIGKTDSAIFYFRKMLNYHDEIDNLKDGYEGLLSVYTMLQMKDSITKYTRLSEMIHDSIKKTYIPEKFLLSHALYHTDKNPKQSVWYSKLKSRFIFVVSLVCVTLLVIICAVYIFIKRIKSTQERKLNSEKRKNKRSTAKYSQVKNELQSAKKKYDKDISLKNKEITELKKTIYNIQKEKNINGKDYDENIASYLTAHLELLRTLSIKGLCAKSEDLRKLHYLVSEFDSNFVEYISSPKYDFNNREIFICIFIRYNFQPSDISILLKISPQSTSNLRAKINQKLFGISSTRHLDDNIKGLKIKHM